MFTNRSIATLGLWLLVYPSHLPFTAYRLPTTAAQPKAEATSLLGKPLVPAPISAEARKTLEENLKQAEIVYGKNPDDPDATIWMGRRIAYLGRYRDAIETSAKGSRSIPTIARMYRHRGHRYITVREFPSAIADFSKAAQLVAGKPDQVEPDGQPNARNTPTSTLQSNIYYHLALAHYLSGDFAKATEAYVKCMTVSKNPDMLVATTYWYYLALARQGRTAEATALLAPITPGMDIIENASYHRLLRLFKGELTPESLLAPARRRTRRGDDALRHRRVAPRQRPQGPGCDAAERNRRRLSASVAGVRIRRRGSRSGEA